MLTTTSMAANKSKRETEKKNWWMLPLLIVYLAILCYLVFFSKAVGRTELSPEFRYNLVPFREIGRFLGHVDTLGWEIVLMNVVGNVVVFLPFGTLLPMLFDKCKKFYVTLLAGFVLTLAIETTQLFSRVGSFDVDDLILNTLGVLLGYLLYLVFRKKDSL